MKVNTEYGAEFTVYDKEDTMDRWEQEFKDRGEKIERLRGMRDKREEIAECVTLEELANIDIIKDENEVPEMANSILQGVLDEGKYKGHHYWSLLDTMEHVQHAFQHIITFSENFENKPNGEIVTEEEYRKFIEEHLYHAFCRMMMACITYNISKRADEFAEERGCE